MTRSTRIFLAIAIVTALLTVGGTVALATAVYRAGVVEVTVTGSGDNISVRIPGVVFPVAARLVPVETFGEVAMEVAPYLPAIRAAFDELTRCEDAVFVEVHSKGDHVRIGKREGVFFVDVQSQGEIVHVALPLHAVGPVLSRLESAVRQAV